MPGQIISASGTQYGLIVNPDGSINTAISGTITIGSVSATVDSIYVQSGTFFMVSGNAWDGVGSNYNTNLYPGSHVYQGTIPWSVNGSVYPIEDVPTASIYTNPRIVLQYSGTSLGSVWKFIGTGSYVKVLGYSGAVLTSVSSWGI